ncbi:hypothetical protein D3C86_2159910 [compost metagenome]
MAGQQPLAAGAGQHGEAAGLHLCVELDEVVLAEGGGDVHEGFSWRNGFMLGRILAYRKSHFPPVR